MVTKTELQERVRAALTEHGKHSMQELMARLDVRKSATLRAAIKDMADVKQEGNTKARRYWV